MKQTIGVSPKGLSKQKRTTVGLPDIDLRQQLILTISLTIIVHFYTCVTSTTGDWFAKFGQPITRLRNAVKLGKSSEPRKRHKTIYCTMEASNKADNEIFRVNNDLCGFSPCGKFFAIAYQSNLIVKKARTLETLHQYEFADVIEYIEWSPNGEYVLCASIKKAIVKVYSINYPEWRCKLLEGSAGMQQVKWSLDSAHIISVADFNIQISIWSLDSQTVTYIHNLKSLTNSNIALSPNGKSLAVITTNGGVDSVEIYKTQGWKISRAEMDALIGTYTKFNHKLLCEKLSAIDGLSWSPNSELLCIWCSISGETKLLVYSTTSNSHVGAFSPEVSSNKTTTNDGTRSTGIYHGPRGIDRVSWNPSGQLLAIVAFNETIVLLNYVTWKPILELRCEPVIMDTDYLGKVYRDCAIGPRDSSVNFGQSDKQKMDEVNERPINIPIATNSSGLADGPSIAKIDIFEYSSCGRYLAVRHEVYSSTMWIWDIAEDSVHHLLLKRPVSGVCWSPNQPRLVVFDESPFIFEWWAGRDATRHPSPRGMTVLSGRWHPSGNFLALCGYNKTAIMRLGG